MAPSKIVLFAALLGIAAADIVTFSTCEESNEDVCKINEVRVTPCTNGKTCILPRGSDASISFDFTPNFSSSNLKTMVYWVNNGNDIEFAGFGSDNACDYMTCPTVAGQTQALNYNLHVGRKLPKAQYPVKWKIWNPDNEDEKCCFKFSIRLTNPKKANTE